MTVTLLSSPADLPADPPDGLFVLVRETPAEEASALAATLGCGRPVTAAQAALNLSARASATAPEEVAAEAAEQREAALDLARERAAEALDRVPTRARGVPRERLQNASAAVRAAEAAVLDARAQLGERPELPAEAAQAALAAEEAVTGARQQRSVGVDRSSKLLLAANAAGILIVAGRIRTPALDPLFVLVAALPLTALLHLVVTLGANTWTARTAASLRAAALRDAGMATMTGLVARNARVKAWTARADALAAAEAGLAEARRRWTGLTGASAGPSSIAALLRTVEEAERTAAGLARLEAEAEAEGAAAAPIDDPAGALVILLEGAADDALDQETLVLLERLRMQEVPAPVVVVSASSDLARWAGAGTVDTAVEGDAEGAGAQVLDIRERVMASLDRLRARAASFGDPTPPGDMAAEG
ncbi:MAG TPA: hypothetical protein VNA57_01450 [Acidimicrobiales bacterium]|nr:hypothetical protein [Acidimicrobiales bacterium]